MVITIIFILLVVATVYSFMMLFVCEYTKKNLLSAILYFMIFEREDWKAYKFIIKNYDLVKEMSLDDYCFNIDENKKSDNIFFVNYGEKKWFIYNDVCYLCCFSPVFIEHTIKKVRKLKEKNSYNK